MDINWEEYIKVCTELGERICVSSNDSNSIVVAIGRGGLIPAQIIAYRCGIQDVYNCGIKSYEGNDQKKFQWYQDCVLDLAMLMGEGKKERVILVDDIADSGKTILEVEKALMCVGCWVKTAVVYYKKKSGIEVDYMGKMVEDDVWVNFPYDIPEDMH